MNEFGDNEDGVVADGNAEAAQGGASPQPDRLVESDEIGSCEDDAVFQAEQEHLSDVYGKLLELGRAAVRDIAKADAEAAADKQSMSDELTVNLASYADAMETYADFAAMNRVIDGYNTAQESRAKRLADIRLLLKQPYFAKVALRYKPGQEPKEFYIGAAGVSDESYRRLVIDWRSPVAEVYYNQDTGRTSYEANGRVIEVELEQRRQFDIEEDRLIAYFDTSVAIQDSLLLASLSKQRSARMQAITATIQKEQNVVVHHDDVDVLLVNGIAGSGKTSVLLQRIAYLFYRRRDDLDPSEVFLISPNPLFSSYIGDVLPDLGERNPMLLTWEDYARMSMPANHGGGNVDVPLSTLRRIDEAIPRLSFENGDFRDIAVAGVRFISASQIAQIEAKFKRIPMGPHRLTLVREEIAQRVEARFSQLAGSEAVHDEISELSIDEQLSVLGEVFDPQDDREARDLARKYLDVKFAAAREAVLADEWLRFDRIGMRMLSAKSIEPAVWLYLRIALAGYSDPQAKYVMIDEVQDYTVAQLAVLARYFRRAHFLLLGDKNQAIEEHTASFDEIEELFERLRGQVSRCSLMTSYRSTPSITSLFAGLLPADEQMRISSVQREQTPARVASYADDASYAEALRDAVSQARAEIEREGGTCAIIVPWKREAKRTAEFLGAEAPDLLDATMELPESGVMMVTLKLAKGLEFDRVIVADAGARLYPDDQVSRNRLYTAISRATKEVVVLARGEISPLLACRA